MNLFSVVLSNSPQAPYSSVVGIGNAEKTGLIPNTSSFVCVIID